MTDRVVRQPYTPLPDADAVTLPDDFSYMRELRWVATPGSLVYEPVTTLPARYSTPHALPGQLDLPLDDPSPQPESPPLPGPADDTDQRPSARRDPRSSGDSVLAPKTNLQSRLSSAAGR